MGDKNEWVFTVHIPKYINIKHVKVRMGQRRRTRHVLDFIKAFWRIDGWRSFHVVNTSEYDDHTVYTVVARKPSV